MGTRPAPPDLTVVAGVLRDADGRVLLARRPPGGHLEGLWEFPGGKLEAGETEADALARELCEELAIGVEQADPWLRVVHRYPERRVALCVWRVRAWRGMPRGREGQAIAWVAPPDLAAREMPPADRPVLRALGLPEQYLVTPEPDAGPGEFIARLAGALDRGAGVVQLRAKGLETADYEVLARAALEQCRDRGSALVLNADPALVSRLGAQGAHLDSRRLMAAASRPLGPEFLVGASCHGPEELEHAVRIGADYALLSPVRATPGHPWASPLGWARFERLVRDLPIPVYALGGVGPGDLAEACRRRAHGVAGIRGYWEERPR